MQFPERIPISSLHSRIDQSFTLAWFPRDFSPASPSTWERDVRRYLLEDTSALTLVFIAEIGSRLFNRNCDRGLEDARARCLPPGQTLREKKNAVYNGRFTTTSYAIMRHGCQSLLKALLCISTIFICYFLFYNSAKRISIQVC